MYSVKLLKPASRDLEKLDKPTAIRVVRRLRWLAENLDSINPERLKGELRGLYKLREGDYRIVYGLLRSEQTIVVHLIGHRREVYKSKH
ncbi:MAG TPA: type II toxin-antitoxin system RelE/ParE family toxin [Pyrinomonadaceae bacterium]|nr:type II toxin-antitoxin system RelE/ParE family toxin [Pyrinomonadaceae bacterium]